MDINTYAEYIVKGKMQVECLDKCGKLNVFLHDYIRIMETPGHVKCPKCGFDAMFVN